MSASLRDWRNRNSLTQAGAAHLLGVSQSYLSLLERGARPLRRELRDRMDMVPCPPAPPSTEHQLRAQLRALGYPGFIQIDVATPVPDSTSVLLEAISQPTLDTPVTEALPWLAQEHSNALDWEWLVQQAKFRNLQNRLGFLIELAIKRKSDSRMNAAKEELERARLLAEATFCWDSMPAATRTWMRQQRAPEAEHWNVVSLLRVEHFSSQATRALA